MKSNAIIFADVIIELGITYMEKNPQYLQLVTKQNRRKQVEALMEYQTIENLYYQQSDEDRVFPLDTVMIKGFEHDNRKELVDAVIHLGAYADEMTYDAHALALTIGDHIFFRSNKFNPSDEDGRKLIAHELTHVAQYNERKEHYNLSDEELEIEAEQAETIEENPHDPIVTVKIRREVYRMRKSQKEALEKKLIEDIEEWVGQQKYCLTEEKYLLLLCNYFDWLERTKLYGVLPR